MCLSYYYCGLLHVLGGAIASYHCALFYQERLYTNFDLNVIFTFSDNVVRTSVALVAVSSVVATPPLMYTRYANVAVHHCSPATRDDLSLKNQITEYLRAALGVNKRYLAVVACINVASRPHRAGVVWPRISP